MTGVLGSSVNFTWAFHGGNVDIVEWGTKKVDSAAVFSFTVDLKENTSSVINLHRVALSRPAAPVQFKF